MIDINTFYLSVLDMNHNSPLLHSKEREDSYHWEKSSTTDIDRKTVWFTVLWRPCFCGFSTLP